eukprot:TRINITY_DN1276_c0_g1_i1.p1 TRINITY_DN1276_c0_g1~~TRINITY_DN1276_c0_g1_i1.p1  ORF type:complete len:146 (-),score=14.48 TRINITY_DN1276_c0_g1_i1:4-441(-)
MLEEAELLQLDFLVSNMLTSLRVVLHELQLFRRRALVLGGGIEVPGASCRFQLDFFATAFSHFIYPSLSDFAASTQIGQDGVNAVLVDQAQTGVGNAQAQEAVFRFDPETTVLQVRQETAFGSIVGMGNVVPNHRAFTRYPCTLR